MPNPDTPRWKSAKLTDHHIKRVRKDDNCWRDILGITRPMTESEYEKESYTAYEKAVLEYEADERDNSLHINRVDKRTIKTVTDLNRINMITCYHEHYDRSHVNGSPHNSMVENTLRFLRALDNRLAGNVVKKMQRLELINNNINNSKHRSKNSPLVQTIGTIRNNYIK